MKRMFESGCQKRKKKRALESQVSSLPKVDSYFTIVTKTSSAESENNDNLLDQQQQPQESTSSTSVDETNLIGSAPDVDIIAEVQIEQQQKTTNRYSDDVGLWTTLTNEDISFWVEKGPSACQHWEGPFGISKQIFKNQARYCSPGLFQSTKVNGEKYDREWLVYSPTTGSVYCFVCKLFSTSTSSSSLANNGFNDWRNPKLIQSHENSENHRTALLTYLTRKRGFALDSKLEDQIKKEQEYWRQVLQRVVGVICTLAERGLPFRGDIEKFNSPRNGNYLGSLELIAKFDPFLADHIERYGNSGSGKPSYLSKTICDELIDLMAKKVRKSILDDLRQAGYFSLSVDSTPDLSHVDQLTVIIRYVSPHDGHPIERFLTFLPLQNHSGENLANVVLDYLVNECRIDFNKCRGQSYDNAANMSGKYKGMQQKFLDINKYAVYIPCAGHSLNLIGRAAVDCCVDAVNFFAVIQQIYTFFSASTKRWATLNSYLGSESAVPKRLSDTRWEAHAKATAAIIDNYDLIKDALDQIQNDKNQNGETKREADIIQDKMEEFEFMFMLVLWNYILTQFYRTSKTLQDTQTSLSTCAKLYASLSFLLRETRNSFDSFEEKAKEELPNVDYKCANKRRRIRKKQVNDGNASDITAQLTPRENFRIKSFIPIIDSLETNLQRRAEVYENISRRFAFLLNFDQSSEDLEKNVKRLMKDYPEDIDDNFYGEIKHFHVYMKQNYSEEKVLLIKMYYNILITEDKVQAAFPNVEAIFRLFLSLMVTNCSGERSFSRLKRIQNENRTTMLQGKLSSLSILCIESDKLRSLSFDDIISDFSAIKSRRQMF